jgi:hypothetical protein
MAPRTGQVVAKAWVAMTSVAYSENRIDCCTDQVQGATPAYEAKLIHQYDSNYASFRGVDKKSVDAGEPQITSPQEKSGSVYFRYFFDNSVTNEFLDSKGLTNGWILTIRDVTNINNERTAISTVIPRTALIQPLNGISVATGVHPACILAAINSIVLDFVARQRIAGRHLNVTTFGQLPYPNSEIDATFVVPRILELTYTNKDLAFWANELDYNGPIFTFDLERRAVLRAELDAYYARLYGLDRDELRYILDPADVMGADYPSETFRVLKNSEIKEFGEYRTARLVLREFDRMALADASGETYQSLLVPPPGQQSSQQYSSIGIIRDENEARLAGLVLALIRQAGTLPRQQLTFSLAALQNEMLATNAPPAAVTQLSAYRQSHSAMQSDQPERLQSVLRFFETSGAIRIQQQGTLIESIAEAPLPSGVIVEPDAEVIAGILLRIASAGLEQQEAEAPGTASQPATKQA